MKPTDINGGLDLMTLFMLGLLLYGLGHNVIARIAASLYLNITGVY